MPKFLIRDRYYVSYGDRPDKKYWPELSKLISEEYGLRIHSHPNITYKIAGECFDYFVNKFQNIIKEEVTLEFYGYVFDLVEESILLWQDFFKNLSIGFEKMDEFAKYQRSLYLILEQAINIDLISIKINNSYGIIFEEKLEDLLFIGEWVYSFAAVIREMQMFKGCFFILFNNKNEIEFQRKEPYKTCFEQLESEFITGHLEGLSALQLQNDLNNAVKSFLKVDIIESLKLVTQLIPQVTPGKVHLSTLPFQALVKAYCEIHNVNSQSVAIYFEGLLLNRDNKLSLKDSVFKPININRYLFRPILELNINGEKRVLTSRNKINESLVKLSSDAINWAKAPDEWRQNLGIASFVKSKAELHDQILDDEVEKILTSNNKLFDRNIRSLKRSRGVNVRINESPGQIDFLYLDQTDKIINVIECKYHITKYDIVSNRDDVTNFSNYENKLSKKINYVKNNKQLIEEHFSIISGINIDLNSYTVEGIFFTNTPTFYNFIGTYRAYHLTLIRDYVADKFRNRTLNVTCKQGDFSIQEPFLKTALDIANSIDPK